MRNPEKKRRQFNKVKKTRIDKMYELARDIRNMKQQGMTYFQIAEARGMPESLVRHYAK